MISIHLIVALSWPIIISKFLCRWVCIFRVSAFVMREAWCQTVDRSMASLDYRLLKIRVHDVGLDIGNTSQQARNRTETTTMKEDWRRRWICGARLSTKQSQTRTNKYYQSRQWLNGWWVGAATVGWADDGHHYRLHHGWCVPCLMGFVSAHAGKQN